MNQAEIAVEYKVGTRVKVLDENATLFGDHAWVIRIDRFDVLLKNQQGSTEWIDAREGNIKRTQDQSPP